MVIFLNTSDYRLDQTTVDSSDINKLNKIHS